MEVTANTTSAASIQDILAEADQASSDVRKDAKITRRLYHQKNMNMLDKNIGKMKEQQSQLGKAGWFSFIVGMFAQFAQVLNFIVPGLGTAVSNIIQQLNHINPFTKKAGAAGVEAEKFKKKAEQENFRESMEDERIKAMAESNQIFKSRMEKAIEDVQKSQEAAVRV